VPYVANSNMLRCLFNKLILFGLASKHRNINSCALGYREVRKAMSSLSLRQDGS